MSNHGDIHAHIYIYTVIQYIIYKYIYIHIIVYIYIYIYISHPFVFLYGDGWSHSSWYRAELNHFVCQNSPFNKDVADSNWYVFSKPRTATWRTSTGTSIYLT